MQEPALATQELLRRAKAQDYSGSKTAFYALVANVRSLYAGLDAEAEAWPGEFSEHDFGRVELRKSNGESLLVHFLVSRLRYSQYVSAVLLSDNRLETQLRGLVTSFSELGGLPLMAVLDGNQLLRQRNQSAGRTQHAKAIFAQAMLELGLGVELSDQRRRTSQRTELASWLKNACLSSLCFRDESDLEAQLQAWLLGINTTPLCTQGRGTPERRRQHELKRLRPLAATPENLTLHFPAVVGADANVVFEGHSYAVPATACGHAGTLLVTSDRVRISVDEVVVEHVRLQQRGANAPAPQSAVPQHPTELAATARVWPLRHTAEERRLRAEGA
jgi:hypothetical protein